ncbi:hypothetical protein Mp_6g01180 [Marchantia polymorpha subsp. ruderalis]|uniref:Uncharacterized protein n=2 Tax=Marchantia polymorpha TaxID=3197 RepID=A0AAF6BMB2_MARPO|nr:hypothetical protein MARPO_0052s0087 [Marchantia polymorpha]PTQ38303.1 hypothetical protein MARPO_0052s0087 [Marchantia polymorpha]BBN13145.1 hypothetical protein Mp_6g01180 [Marchantia polymorpha subsp. ruderalis]BBN13146.1 hypothetical protein Mp_6g01180 [Marchantia polymorpha subsp. ruderalis]|eukprot:PTQ38302.1 hypothetical protein MARPO_0052s0087 [Marchantia polymorpha]
MCIEMELRGRMFRQTTRSAEVIVEPKPNSKVILKRPIDCRISFENCLSPIRRIFLERDNNLSAESQQENPIF